MAVFAKSQRLWDVDLMGLVSVLLVYWAKCSVREIEHSNAFQGGLDIGLVNYGMVVYLVVSALHSRWQPLLILAMARENPDFHKP